MRNHGFHGWARMGFFSLKTIRAIRVIRGECLGPVRCGGAFHSGLVSRPFACFAVSQPALSFAARRAIRHRLGMPRSLVSRSLEPLVAVLWGVFLVWTAWLAVVWIAPVGANALGFVEGTPAPPNADLRGAVLLLANHADVIWLALAVMNLHLVLTRAHGLRTARAWLAFSAGGALALGALNAKTGLPFGRLYFGEALGPKVLGVPSGWLLLWAVLVMSAREVVLRLRPRTSHAGVAAVTAVLVVLTAVNLDWPARFIRGWWVWQSGDARNPSGVPWMNWAAWFAGPWLMAFAMREKTVLSGVAPRSLKPVVILASLNAIALAAKLRTWLANDSI